MSRTSSLFDAPSTPLSDGSFGCFNDCPGVGDSAAPAPPIAILSDPFGLVACAHAVFYSDGSNGVYRASPTGGEAPLKLADAPNIGYGLGCDGDYVYWAGTFADAGASGYRTSIFRVPVAGGDVELVATVPIVEPGLEVANGSVYFLAPSPDGGAAIQRVATDGDGGIEILARLANYPSSLRPFGARVDDVVSISGADLVSIPLDGGVPITLVADAGASSVIANATFAFYQAGDNPDSLLASANDAAEDRPLSGFTDLALNDTRLLVETTDIESLDPSDVSQPPIVVATPSSFRTWPMAADEDRVYWMEGPIVDSLSVSLHSAPLR